LRADFDLRKQCRIERALDGHRGSVHALATDKSCGKISSVSAMTQFNAIFRDKLVIGLPDL
jgi:hypothetical protein